MKRRRYNKYGITRREMLSSSALAAAGVMFGGSPLSAKAQAVKKAGKAKSVIQVFLWGGMSHTDTWDPKPNAGYDYTGQFNKVIPTNVDGIKLSTLFPKLAQQADKYSLIRSMTHGINGHETAAYLMQTGHTPGERLAYPCVGAVFSLMKGYTAGYKGLIPPYVVLTKPQGRFSESGFLGSKYKPFATGGDPNAQRFEVEGVVARGISDMRQKGRRSLLRNLNSYSKSMPDNSVIQNSITAEDSAYDLILGEGKDVFDLSLETKELRKEYGLHTFGQDCLVARRLVEVGVPYVTINYPGGWDTHSNHFSTMTRQCPQLDQGLARLLQDLDERGLLESTVVWCCGEFGRSPKVDWQPPWNGGRNHYGKCNSVLIAGGGFKGGTIVGKSTERGEEPAERPVYPVDLLGSIYTIAGIDMYAKLPHPMGLEAQILPKGDKIKSAGLLEEIM
jgi:hypothetical protein